VREKEGGDRERSQKTTELDVAGAPRPPPSIAPASHLANPQMGQIPVEFLSTADYDFDVHMTFVPTWTALQEDCLALSLFRDMPRRKICRDERRNALEFLDLFYFFQKSPHVSVTNTLNVRAGF